MRTIDADALQEVFRKKCPTVCACCSYYKPKTVSCGLIDNAPTIKPTTVYEFKGCDNCELERPKGKWINRCCTECGTFTSLNIFNVKYCPECGARMESDA